MKIKKIIYREKANIFGYCQQHEDYYMLMTFFQKWEIDQLVAPFAINLSKCTRLGKILNLIMSGFANEEMSCYSDSDYCW